MTAGEPSRCYFPIVSIHCLGASSEVGRSCFLIDGSKKIILDAGVKLAEDDEEYPLLEMAQARRLDRIVLSHAHLDHSGFIPYLYREGCRAPCLMTKPTRDLIQVMLADYARLNKQGTAYKDKDIRTLLNHTKLLEYEQPKDGTRFSNAGHILGSAVSEIELDGKKILYTGDINLRPTRLLDGAKTGYQADALIIESTYGSKIDRHPSMKEVSNQLAGIICQTLEGGGKILIPTFAIGRGQELLFLLESYMRSGLIPRIPIYLDGMVNKVLRIYRHNALFLKAEVQRQILSSDDDPFKGDNYFIPKTKDRSDVLEEEKAIILATSGMLNGGPVLQYLKKMGDDERNTLIFCGFQAKGTRGRELLDGARELTIDDELVPITMRIEQAKISGHSDHAELVEFTRRTTGLNDIIIVHGEGEKSQELATAIQKIHPKARVHVPKLGQEIEI